MYMVPAGCVLMEAHGLVHVGVEVPQAGSLKEAWASPNLAWKSEFKLPASDG
jgi:hypothetical protein